MFYFLIKIWYYIITIRLHKQRNAVCNQRLQYAAVSSYVLFLTYIELSSKSRDILTGYARLRCWNWSWNWKL